MLKVDKISYKIGTRQLLREVSFVVNIGEKVGLVGVNGAGKTTLLKCIVGEIAQDAGTVIKPEEIGYVPQTVTVYGKEDHKTVFEYIAAAQGLDALSHQLQELTAAMNGDRDILDSILKNYDATLSAFEAKGGWKAEAEIAKILAGLGLDFVALDRTIGTLSGGQKTRIALARALFSEPKLLILDEPTNHLDLDAKTWLMEYLSHFSGAVLMISHDLKMLDSAVTKILYLNEFNQSIESFPGNYTNFLNQKEVMDERIRKTVKTQKAEIERLRETAIRNLSAGPKQASQGHSILKRVEKMEAQLPEEPKQSRTIKADFSISRTSGDKVVSVTELAKWYGDKEVVKPISFEMMRGERWAVIGVNGAGKSTLLKMIVHKIFPTSGSCTFGASVDVGYYSQEHEELNLQNTLLQECRLVSKEPEGYLRGALAHFLFQNNKVFEPVSVLSGGERSRLALCKLILHGHNYLVMDEPTNNLDPLSVSKLVEALKPYAGTMLVVSHSLEFLLELKPSMVILMPEAQIKTFDERVYDTVREWE